MEYKLQTSDKKSHVVCRDAFAAAWGISVYQLKEISKALKISEHGRVVSTSHRKMTDATLLDYNYSETADIFSINAGIAGNAELFAKTVILF